MEKIILIDGNNLLFRSYYATAYNGNFMSNSKGFPTNALYGFVNMINKIIKEENPIYILVAFDKGKTFRHDKFDFYKEGRIEMPNELKQQFPIAKEILTKMGIKYYEIDNYEADDIIGTFARFCDEDEQYIGTIVSSDKDLLQLISTDIEVKLLKSKDYIRYDYKKFIEDYNIEPINIIDLKALMGDASDNIPGVKGIGEKTALKLLSEYKNIDNLYKNIEQIKGKLQEKLIEGKKEAYMSYEIATIDKHVPLDINVKDIKYNGPTNDLNSLFEELEFYSFLKSVKKEENKTTFKVIEKIDELLLTKDSSIYIETLGTNYHNSKIIGAGIYNESNAFYISWDNLKDDLNILIPYIKYTYDVKKMYVICKTNNVELNIIDDIMIMASILEYNLKEDIAYLANILEYDIPFYDSIYGKSNKLIEPDINVIAENTILKAKFVFDAQKILTDKLKNEDSYNLYKELELPLAIVLGNMEYNGVNVNKKTLNDMRDELKIKIEIISNDIYNLAGIEFNISSPKQLGEILFERLELKHGKKNATGFSTSIDVLNKLKGKHPIIELIIEYRMLTKLYSTYVEGLLNSISDDNKIHTIYTQTVTRTGRLSSIEPNLQNIPIRYEEGRLIRKAFVPSQDSIILSCDYSQIELRILAHMANVESLIEAFKNGEDIHTKTASDIFKVEKQAVDTSMRRIAKAVNFGIIYGISSFGLSENLDISMIEAKQFIETYLHTYPGIKEYMDETIKEAYVNYSVKTLFNRKRAITELKNTNYMIRQQGERIALNTPIQGTSADIIKKAMIEIYDEFKKQNIKSKIILQVHDELIFDVIKSELEVVTKIVVDIMENTFKLNVPLKVDPNTGDNWYQAK